jgi:uncharacterized membrane-anchored protein
MPFASRVGRAFASVSILALFASASGAQSPTTPEAFEKTLTYRTGTIPLPDANASLTLPAGWRYLSAADAKRLIEDGWGNPSGAGDGNLGMIIPPDLSPLAEEGWGVVVTYDESGHVKDSDAAETDFAKLLSNMQEGTRNENSELQSQGMKPRELVGWAEPPHYDSQAKKLYWATHLRDIGEKEGSLNYNVRVLGRRGVLELTAVSGIQYLPAIRGGMQNVLTFASFDAGNTYADFKEGSDKVAAVGIAGLIAGGAAIATKGGFFKVLLAGLLAAKKLVAVGAIALFGLIAKLFGRKKEAAPDPTPPSAS